MGRESELAALTACFDATVGGERRLGLVMGEPGIGKTRLVRQAAEAFAASGALVLGGRCLETPLHVLEPFAEAVGGLALQERDRIDNMAPGTRPCCRCWFQSSHDVVSRSHPRTLRLIASCCSEQ
ncbi:MAG: ATP-binding protein [Microthrixaceae bacterium]|nr:ATP-binding protein [Microthrixaceae bacterium]